ncbi:hypothetical protein [Nonomuraea harbinensis]|uniref:DUF998 domain-containing protein n=1 Tax=Nonomuraea harbinensis TaxID=1286938 RepID=A0ABW1C660_9ACTN|nr:hypothetical protein [Nonomuraea harbinensis]
MDDQTTRPYGSRCAAVAMAGGGVLYSAAGAFYWAMFPDEVSETAANADVAASALGAWRVETLLFALAHLLLLPAMAGSDRGGRPPQAPGRHQAGPSSFPLSASRRSTSGTTTPSSGPSPEGE